MKTGIPIFVLPVLCLGSASIASADVQITMQNGRVTVVAKDATLRQIMTEWARVGQTKVVNVDRIPGGPVTLELRNVSEDQALDVLMRPLSGYLAAPRSADFPNLSRFDRIIVMPTIAAAKGATASGGSTPPPVFQSAPVIQPPPPVPEEPEEEEKPPPQRPPVPVFSSFPQPQVINPNGAAPNGQVPAGGEPPVPTQPVGSGVPTAPAGVAVPGMVVPVPQQPGAPGQQNPQQPRRPGGR